MTPSDFLIRCMEDIDDVKDVAVIRRHEDGAITFDSARRSRFDTYAMVCGVKATIEAEITVTELND